MLIYLNIQTLKYILQKLGAYPKFTFYLSVIALYFKIKKFNLGLFLIFHYLKIIVTLINGVVYTVYCKIVRLFDNSNSHLERAFKKYKFKVMYVVIVLKLIPLRACTN